MKTIIPLFLLSILMLAVHSATARTVTLDDSHVTHMAHIGPHIPLAGWVGRMATPGSHVAGYVDLTPGMGLLMQYPLDAIPPGQRIVSAQWIIPTYTAANQRVYAWRLLQSWGVGVCHRYRTTIPQPLEWSTPGARGPGQDRALANSGLFNITSPDEITLDVTQDVELWYTGMAPNHGWLVAIDEAAALLRVRGPFFNGQNGYRLRITYEPE